MPDLRYHILGTCSLCQGPIIAAQYRDYTNENLPLRWRTSCQYCGARPADPTKPFGPNILTTKPVLGRSATVLIADDPEQPPTEDSEPFDEATGPVGPISRKENTA